MSHPVNSVGFISVEHIEANPYQPRTHFDQEALQELADSIKIQGIIQPVTLRQMGTNSYQLISGERRLQASKLAGLETIPAYIRKADDQQMLEMALIENIQRENLNAIEIALSYQRLLSECNLRQEELGDRVGKNRSTVTNYLRLLKLPPDMQIGLRDAEISMGHARALIGIDDPKLQVELFRKIVAEELSVRRVEELVRNGYGRNAAERQAGKADGNAAPPSRGARGRNAPHRAPPHRPVWLAGAGAPGAQRQRRNQNCLRLGGGHAAHSAHSAAVVAASIYRIKVERHARSRRAI